MNRRYTALATSALAIGTVALTATEASAMVKDPGPGSTPTACVADAYDWPDEGSGYPGYETKSPEYNYPNYDPRYEVPRVEAATISSAPDHNGVELVQAGASAVGGVVTALGAMWLYRRRHMPTT